MKKRILLAAVAMFGITVNAQTQGTVTMGPQNSNQVYYKFSTNESTGTYANDSWDVAFWRISAMDMGIRVNEAKGLQTFEVGATSVWSTVDVSQEETWTALNNSEQVWQMGSVSQGSAPNYGWGAYNPVTHHVTGTRVFVLKYADGSFKKIKFDDYYGGYTFTYSTWNGTAWSADTTQTIANSASANRFFNYFNLDTNAIVTAEPENTQWDIVFTKYMADYFGDGSLFYPVTGVFHHPNVLVSENIEAGTMPANPTLDYSENISTIGYDWKSFTGGSYVISDKVFYVKLANLQVYRLDFTSFAGSSTGVITFNHEDVTNLLATEELPNKVSFGVYPNPTTDKRISVVFDGAGAGANNSVSIFSLTGAKVYDQKLDSNGFANAELNLSNLSSGVYILKFESGDYSATRKIVLQ